MPTTRRHFLGTAAGATLAGPLLAQQAAPARSPNDHIQVALIGAGGQGMGDADNAARVPGVKLVAVSDCYDGRLARSKELWGNQLFTTRRYEEILARPDIDAVIVGTPDHWHQKISIDAMNAGKDVYCQKPIVQHIDDGARVVETQRKTGRIMQVGSQRVSSIVYEKARELFRQGAIGQLNMVEAWWDRNSAIGAWEYSIAPDASPQTIDWDRFVGRAPKRSFDAERFFRWRCYRDYGTGVAGDLFVHLFSGMHYVTGAIGPERVYAVGGLRFWKDGRDVPDVLVGLYDYAKTDAHPAFNLMLRVNFVNGGSENSGFRFIGSEGIMTIGDGVTLAKHPRETEPGYTIGTFAKSEQEALLKKYREEYPERRANADSLVPDDQEQYTPPDDYSDHYDHISRFFASVRSRKPVVEDPVFGFRAAGPALLSNMSYFEQRIVAWDPASMTVARG